MQRGKITTTYTVKCAVNDCPSAATLDAPRKTVDSLLRKEGWNHDGSNWICPDCRGVHTQQPHQNP